MYVCVILNKYSLLTEIPLMPILVEALGHSNAVLLKWMHNPVCFEKYTFQFNVTVVRETTIITPLNAFNFTGLAPHTTYEIVIVAQTRNVSSLSFRLNISTISENYIVVMNTLTKTLIIACI